MKESVSVPPMEMEPMPKGPRCGGEEGSGAWGRASVRLRFWTLPEVRRRPREFTEMEVSVMLFAVRESMRPVTEMVAS